MLDWTSMYPPGKVTLTGHAKTYLFILHPIIYGTLVSSIRFFSKIILGY